MSTRVRLYVLTRLLGLLITLNALPCAADPSRLRIGYFNPHTASDTFFSQMEGVMQAAADDLNIDLRIYRAEFDHRAQISQFEQAIVTDGIQGALFGDFRQNGLRLMERAERHKIPVLLFNTPLSFDNLAKSGGGPRQRYRYWIGELVPDEPATGYQLAQQLHRIARSRSPTQPPPVLEMIGISGDLSDNSSLERIRGLQRYATIHSSTLVLKQVVNATNWSRQEAQFQIGHLLRRYPQSRMLWAASDTLALGALDGTKHLGGSLVLGGVDWTLAGLDAIARGAMEVSLGGHFLEGGWALVLLHDYLHGQDFAPLQGVRFTTRLLPVGRERAADYADILREQRWSALDFKDYSRVYSPGLQRYAFDIHAAMEKLVESRATGADGKALSQE